MIWKKNLNFTGNPKRGRYLTTQDSEVIPEPEVFVHYQDNSYSRAEEIDIDTVIDNFRNTLNAKKVSKEDLKKVLRKNTDQMGRPLSIKNPKDAEVFKKKSAELANNIDDGKSQMAERSIENNSLDPEDESCDSKLSSATENKMTAEKMHSVKSSYSSEFDPVIAGVVPITQQDEMFSEGKEPSSVFGKNSEQIGDTLASRGYELNQGDMTMCSDGHIGSGFTDMIDVSKDTDQNFSEPIESCDNSSSCKRDSSHVTGISGAYEPQTITTLSSFTETTSESLKIDRSVYFIYLSVVTFNFAFHRFFKTCSNSSYN